MFVFYLVGRVCAFKIFAIAGADIRVVVVVVDVVQTKARTEEARTSLRVSARPVFLE
jgi:hypothetical protein